LLTDKSFGRRLKDLLDRDPEADVTEVRLLKYGRHFHLPGGARIIVGRDESENDVLERLGKNRVKYQVDNFLGPVTLAPAGLDEPTKTLTAAITARYSQGREAPALLIRVSENGREEMLEVAPAKDDDLARWRIG
jgi:hypothetical protein